jgi:membrane peptidoglycan carboxypeptidase
MAQIISTLQRRRNRREKTSHKITSWLVLSCATILSLSIALFLVSSALAYAQLTRQLPSLDLLPLYLEPPDGLLLKPTQLLDRTGTHTVLSLTNPSASGSQYLTIDQLPENVLNAILAANDPSYWDNLGFTWKGFLQGDHPTLAQKAAVEFLLQDEPPSLRRNFRERLLAFQMVHRFGREKILEWYLNSLEFGPLIYGIDAAAHAYFGKPANALDLAEASALAALAEYPGVNPNLDPRTLEDKRNRILQVMLIQGWITTDETIQAGQEKLSYQALEEQKNPSQAFTDLLFDQLTAQIPYHQLARGGFQIITTLDYNLQMQSICAIESMLSKSQSANGEITAPDGSPCQVARLIPDSSKSETLPPNANADLIVLDPQTGQILSLVSSSGHSKVTPITKHDPGSLLNPFLYLTAFTRGFSPGSMLWDLPADTGSDVSTEEKTSYHGPVRLRTALANDYPGPVQQLTDQIGYDNILRTIHQLGFESDKQISLIEAAQAYGVLANQGIINGQTVEKTGKSTDDEHLSPSAVIRVVDNQGKVWVDWSENSDQALVSPQLAYLVNSVLSDETARWPSLGHPNALEVGRPAGAMISRLPSNTEEWTLGYTPLRVAGVWVGSDNNEKIPTNISANLWHAIQQYVSRDLPAKNWPIPQGVNAIKVCDPSGLLPTELCPSIVTEVFLDENVPTQPDNLYRKFEVNRETGKLATVFTPPELINDQTFLALPAEAISWAQENGLPVPPDTYDTIYPPTEPLSTVQILDPNIFSQIRGKIAFTGSAAGDQFQFYRLQVGKGLNPQEWIQIGQDSTRPVEKGTLGTWDTQGLSGLYAIQLLVVRADQRVDRFITQVTVDNEPPHITILYPAADQVFITSKTPSLLFQADAKDDLEIKNVDFVLDGKTIASLPRPPFVLPWQTPTAGKHNLKALAFDLAGNSSTAEVIFVVK